MDTETERTEAERVAAEEAERAAAARDTVMDGGLAIFGIGLFLFAVAHLYVGATGAMAWVLFALSLLSLGLAFSDYHGRRVLALGMGGVLLLLELVAVLTGAAWWIHVLMVAFAAAYFMLWAEYRFPVFGHVGEAEAHVGADLRRGAQRLRHRHRR